MENDNYFDTYDNEFVGYTVVVLGRGMKLNASQENLIMDVVLLANDYDRLKAFIRIN